MDAALAAVAGGSLTAPPSLLPNETPLCILWLWLLISLPRPYHCKVTNFINWYNVKLEHVVRKMLHSVL